MINQLLRYIGKTFTGVDARDILCLAQMILSLIQERTVNLSKLSLRCHYKSERKEASYRRLQRFVARLPITQEQLCSFILGFIPGPYLLAMDRTNWQFGKTPINILTLSVVWNGLAIPVFWSLLPHKGCSGPEDRIALMERFLNLKDPRTIQALVMDREFIGPEWLAYLNLKGVCFHVRLRNNIKIGRGKGEILSAAHTFSHLQKLEKIDLPGKRTIGGKKGNMRLFVSAARSSDSDLVIVACNKDQPSSLERYKSRWGIETLFGCLKTRGFCLEDTHLTDPQKIAHLLMPLTLTFFWAFRVGIWLNEVKEIKLKKHGRKAISFFRLGLEALVKAPKKLTKWLLSIFFETCPKTPPPLSLLTSLGLL